MVAGDAYRGAASLYRKDPGLGKGKNEMYVHRGRCFTERL